MRTSQQERWIREEITRRLGGQRRWRQAKRADARAVLKAARTLATGGVYLSEDAAGRAQRMLFDAEQLCEALSVKVWGR
jgi:hypothetical protein